MKYLVCRTDAIKPDGYMRTSNYFPMIVDTSHVNDCWTYEDIVRAALDRIDERYNPAHSYIVAPLADAALVSFKPRKQYDVITRPFMP